MPSRFALPLLLVSAAHLAHGYDFKSLKPQGYVSDFANVIDTAAKVEIERYCRDLEDRTGVQLAFVTVKTLENEPVSDVANLLYRTWGIGQKKSNEGALLLLAVADRKSRLEIGYGLEPILPDGMSGSVLREMRPALRENHYGDAMIAAARTIGERVLVGKGISGAAPPMRTSRPRSAEPAIPMGIWIFLAIIVLMFFLNSRGGGGGRGRRGGGGFFPVFFPPGFPGSSRGGGGFGGMSDSGGGFGGFGGGDSGGGGASSDW
jgi:uncharacterized protein